MNLPDIYEDVLALITDKDSKETWYEVVAYNGVRWVAQNCDTFMEGEKVVKWVYAKDAMESCFKE